MPSQTCHRFGRLRLGNLPAPGVLIGSVLCAATTCTGPIRLEITALPSAHPLSM
jgi:hypothetical protein